MVLPDPCNHHGTLFGGTALAMLDKLAFILGSKVLRGTLVTAAVGQLDFRAPVPAGSLVVAVGTVARIGCDLFRMHKLRNLWYASEPGGGHASATTSGGFTG